MFRLELKRASKSVRYAIAVLLFATFAVTGIQLLADATNAPPIEGWMLSTGPLP